MIIDHIPFTMEYWYYSGPPLNKFNNGVSKLDWNTVANPSLKDVELLEVPQTHFTRMW
jgi:hypothetical protein